MGNYSTKKPDHVGQLFLKDLKKLPYNTELIAHNPDELVNIQLIGMRYEPYDEVVFGVEAPKSSNNWFIHFRRLDGTEGARLSYSAGLSRAGKNANGTLVGKWIQDRWITLKDNT
jgi:hypothetical protein